MFGMEATRQQPAYAHGRSERKVAMVYSWKGRQKIVIDNSV